MTKTRHEVAVKNVQEKEKGKTLQDTETTTHTAKYRKNYNSVTLADLDEMERNDDHTLAFRSVVKDKIWVKIDFQVMKDAGKNSGYVFFVNKMRTSIQNTPPDNADSRKAYTTGLIYLKEKFEELSTIEEMQDVLLNFTDGKVEGVFTGDSWKVQNTVQKIYGKKFFNFAYQYTTSYSNTVRTAKSYNSISKDEEKQIIQAYVAYLESELKKYQEKYQEFLNIRGAKANHGIYESRIENLEASIQNPENDLNESKYKARPADWSWAFPKKRTKASSGNRTRLNKPELSHIVREGGLEITDVSNENMKDNYGFSLVNYGSSLSSKRREAHAKHFLGAMSDLAQVLDIDLAKANQLGDLQIHFGTSGKKGSMAFYARNLKKININNRNGDGSIAHEWAHYLDNMLAEGSTKRNSPYMATERQAEYPEIQKIIKELKFLFIDGNKVQTYEIEFFAKNAGTYYFNKPLKAKTIEEAIKELRERSPACEWFSYHKRKDIQRSFGIIARTFKVDKITVPYEVHESQFYANSKVLDKKPRGYWTSDVELFARAFEVYILNKLAEHGMKNNYLVSLHGEDRETAPYPYGDEAKVINAKFDELFAKIKEIYEIGNFQSDDKKVASKPSKSKELENVSDSTPLDKPKEEEKPKITRFVAYHGSKVDFDQFSDNSFPYFTDSKSYALSFAKPFGYLYHVEADTLKAFDFTPLGSNMIYRKNIIDLLNQTFEAKGEEILTKDERDEIMLFNLPQNRLQFFNIVRWLGQTQKDGILYRILEKRGYDSWIQRDGVQNTKSKDSPWALVVFEPQNVKITKKETIENKSFEAKETRHEYSRKEIAEFSPFGYDFNSQKHWWESENDNRVAHYYFDFEERKYPVLVYRDGENHVIQKTFGTDVYFKTEDEINEFFEKYDTLDKILGKDNDHIVGTNEKATDATREPWQMTFDEFLPQCEIKEVGFQGGLGIVFGDEQVSSFSYSFWDKRTAKIDPREAILNPKIFWLAHRYIQKEDAVLNELQDENLTSEQEYDAVIEISVASRNSDFVLKIVSFFQNKIKKAISENLYQTAIANGEMTRERAIEIITSAGLDVPQDILDVSFLKRYNVQITEKEFHNLLNVISKHENYGIFIKNIISFIDKNDIHGLGVFLDEKHDKLYNNIPFALPSDDRKKYKHDLLALSNSIQDEVFLLTFDDFKNQLVTEKDGEYTLFYLKNGAGDVLFKRNSNLYYSASDYEKESYSKDEILLKTYFSQTKNSRFEIIDAFVKERLSRDYAKDILVFSDLLEIDQSDIDNLLERFFKESFFKNDSDKSEQLFEIIGEALAKWQIKNRVAKKIIPFDIKWLDEFKNDLSKIRPELEKVIEKTNLYLFPFGETQSTDKKTKKKPKSSFDIDNHLFVGEYPTGTMYGDKRKLNDGDYLKIGFVYHKTGEIKIDIQSDEYQAVYERMQKDSELTQKEYFENKLTSQLLEAFSKNYVRYDWTEEEEMWREKILAQWTTQILTAKEIIPFAREWFDQEPFKSKGGFKRVDKIFDGNLIKMISEINEYLGLENQGNTAMNENNTTLPPPEELGKKISQEIDQDEAFLAQFGINANDFAKLQNFMDRQEKHEDLAYALEDWKTQQNAKNLLRTLQAILEENSINRLDLKILMQKNVESFVEKLSGNQEKSTSSKTEIWKLTPNEYAKNKILEWDIFKADAVSRDLAILAKYKEPDVDSTHRKSDAKLIAIKAHYFFVFEAWKAGKNIPENVLRHYPDFQPRQSPNDPINGDYILDGYLFFDYDTEQFSHIADNAIETFKKANGIIAKVEFLNINAGNHSYIYFWADGTSFKIDENRHLSKKERYEKLVNYLEKSGSTIIHADSYKSVEKPISPQVQRERNFVAELEEKFAQGVELNKKHLQKIARNNQIDPTAQDLIQELTEIALTRNYRRIALSDLPHRERYDKIVASYKKQPNFTSHATSTRKILQQYSTPAPYGFLMGWYCGLENHWTRGVANETGVAFEPSAGNGMLTIGAPEKLWVVNEIRDDNLSILRNQLLHDHSNFAEVHDLNAQYPFTDWINKFEIVMANPPFNSTDKTYIPNVLGIDYEFTRLEMVMLVRALDTRKDDGKSAFIIGGHTKLNKNGMLPIGNNRMLYRLLYDNYKDVHILNLGGELYGKQGTTAETRMIFVGARKEEPYPLALPNITPSDKEVQPITSWDKLYERVQEILEKQDNDIAITSPSVDVEKPSTRDENWADAISQNAQDISDVSYRFFRGITQRAKEIADYRKESLTKVKLFPENPKDPILLVSKNVFGNDIFDETWTFAFFDDKVQTYLKIHFGVIQIGDFPEEVYPFAMEKGLHYKDAENFEAVLTGKHIYSEWTQGVQNIIINPEIKHLAQRVEDSFFPQLARGNYVQASLDIPSEPIEDVEFEEVTASAPSQKELFEKELELLEKALNLFKEGEQKELFKKELALLKKSRNYIK